MLYSCTYITTVNVEGLRLRVAKRDPGRIQSSKPISKNVTLETRNQIWRKPARR